MHSLNVIPAFSIFCHGAAVGIGVCAVSVLYGRRIRRDGQRRRTK
jgi:glycerol dehydrogenase-like iron-containing ADH family enzyme